MLVNVWETLNHWADVDVPTIGGGPGKAKRRHIPGVTGNRTLAMREDEEIVVILQALLASRRKH